MAKIRPDIKVIRRLVACSVVLAAVLVLMLACYPFQQAPPTPTPVPSRTRIPTQTSSPPTPTPTPIPTLALNTLCLVVEQTFPDGVTGAEQPVASTIERILERTGVKVFAPGQPCETSLLVTLNFQPQGDNYPGLLDSKNHYCYTGALANGELRLEPHGLEPRLWPVHWKRGPINGIISHCQGPSEAPFDKVWPYALLNFLGEIKGPAVHYQSLEDENEEIARAACWQVAELKPVTLQAVRALEGVLINDKRQNVREGAAWAFNQMPLEGDNALEALDSFTQALYDENEMIRNAIAQAFGHLKGVQVNQTVPPLIAVLKDDQSSLVRRMAESSLHELTGNDFEEDAAQWQAWLDKQQ